MALAPRLPLLSVPSVSIRIRSISGCFNPFFPASASLILVLMFAIAFLTPSPQYLGSPSLNSIASNCPVLAPEGTAARSQNRSPVSVSVSTTSASTVGFPLESRISLPWIFVICKYRFISKPRFPFLFTIVSNPKNCYTELEINLWKVTQSWIGFGIFHHLNFNKNTIIIYCRDYVRIVIF